MRKWASRKNTSGKLWTADDLNRAIRIRWSSMAEDELDYIFKRIWVKRVLPGGSTAEQTPLPNAASKTPASNSPENHPRR